MSEMNQQLRRHSVALISLVVALSSLGYNTWRNERTEANRNVRTAGIQLLLTLGELDQVVFFSHYDMDQERGSPRAGWAYVLTITDLASLTSEQVDESSRALFDAWQSSWAGLGSDDASEARISGRIADLRRETLAALAALD